MLISAAHASAPGARALYLGARDRKHVSCTDEALVVRNELRQALRYPLARVSRVVSSTVTDWSGDALAMVSHAASRRYQALNAKGLRRAKRLHYATHMKIPSPECKGIKTRRRRHVL